MVLLDLSKQNLDSNGYMYVYQPDHPMANLSGKVYVHRYVGYLKEGRLLTTDEHCHHKDENKLNNAEDNVEVLPAKEHIAIHSTLTGDYLLNKEIFCKYCGDSIMTSVVKLKLNHSYCGEECSRKGSRKFEVSKEVLEKLVWEMPTTKIGKLFGVSDKAIEKRCKLLDINKPERGYWSKVRSTK